MPSFTYLLLQPTHALMEQGLCAFLVAMIKCLLSTGCICLPRKTNELPYRNAESELS